MSDVGLDGAFLHDELRGDLGVGQPLRHELEHHTTIGQLLDVVTTGAPALLEEVG